MIEAIRTWLAERGVDEDRALLLTSLKIHIAANVEAWLDEALAEIEPAETQGSLF